MPLTPKHRENLNTLANYLAALPMSYAAFDMALFYTRDKEEADEVDLYDYEEVPVAARHECGTAACAVGHGPQAGIPPIYEDGHNWLRYARRAFGVSVFDGNIGTYMFGGNSPDQHSPHAAARRIREVLNGDYLG